MIRRIIKSIPNTITCCNLLCGVLACIAGCNPTDIINVAGGITGTQAVWILIAAAAVFDFCDGAAARLLNAPSPLGKELDSLSDLVSFGVAPGILMFNLLGIYSDSAWLPFLSLLIPAMGALRLAKFNIDDSQATTFSGLAIPANAIFWIGASAWITRIASQGVLIDTTAAILATAFIIIAISLMMVSNMPMFSFKIKGFGLAANWMRYLLVAATIALLIIFGVEGLAYTILLYIILASFSTPKDTAHS